MYRKLIASSSQNRGSSGAFAVFLTEPTKRLPASLKAIDRSFGGILTQALQRPESSCSVGHCFSLHTRDTSAPAERLVVVGMGPKDSLDPRAVMTACGAMLRHLAGAGVQHIQLGEASISQATDSLGEAESWQLIGQGLALANFNFKQFKGTAETSTTKPLPKLTLSVPKACIKAIKQGLVLGDSANLSRELAATPPNVAGPDYLMRRCRAMAKSEGLTCRVIDAARAKTLGMGGLLAVGAGGSQPPRIIELEYKPAGAKASKPPILVVGKAITFDTGGYSLKVGGSMKGMKYDKCGGTAVIGIMQAVAQLKAGRRVIGLVACAENMIDREAYRVDDIITISNGVTVEITNTDAEGRLVLADALAYGTKRYKPEAVLDLATLTGGVVVALGNDVSGAWCNDDALWERVDSSGTLGGEPVWRMPVDERYRKMMRAQHADLHNSAPVRAAHPIQGAAFLSYFVGENAPKKMPTIPWCHLDIAGTATTDESSALMEKGPTGSGVGLVARMISDW